MTEDKVPIRKLRRSILQRHKLSPEPATKKLVNPATLHSPYHKTPTQKMLEYKYSILLEDFIFHGSLNDVTKHFVSDGIDRATISKWRKSFKEQRKAIQDRKFFEQFNDGEE
jgi:uncharacterized membrane protein